METINVVKSTDKLFKLLEKTNNKKKLIAS